MAVVPMKRLELYGLKNQRKAVLDLLQRRGVVELETAQSVEGGFSQTDTSQKQQELEQASALLEQAVALLDQYTPSKKGFLSFLAGRTPISQEEYETGGENAPAFLEKAKGLVALEKRLTDGDAQILRLEGQLESLQPWKALDIPLSCKGTATTQVFLGSFSQEIDEATLKNQLAVRLPQVTRLEVEVLSHQPQQSCVFVLCHKDDGSQVGEALRSLGFAYPAVTSPLPPAQQAAALEEEIRKIRQEKEALKQEILDQKDAREGMLLAADYYRAQGEKYKVLGELWQSPHVFYLTGYLPAAESHALIEELQNRFILLAETADPGPQEDPPVFSFIEDLDPAFFNVFHGKIGKFADSDPGGSNGFHTEG